MSNSLYNAIQEAFNQESLNNEHDNQQSKYSTKKPLLDLTEIKEGEYISPFYKVIYKM